MSNDNETDYAEAIYQLGSAINDLRQKAGFDPLPLVKPEAPLCSFCAKGINEVRKMVAGPDVHICDECVAAAQKILLQT